MINMASSSSRTLPDYFKPLKKRSAKQDICLPTDFPQDLINKIKGMVIHSPDYPRPCEKTCHRVWDFMATCEVYSPDEPISRLFEPHPEPYRMHQRIFRATKRFYNVIDGDTNWGHSLIAEEASQAYYIFWLWINLYPAAILFEPGCIHRSRRYTQGRWFDRLFAPIFEDLLTLTLKGGFQITHDTIIIIQLQDIWGEREFPFVQIVTHQHQRNEPLSPGIMNTPDLYFKERIHIARLNNDIDDEAEATMYHHQWLRESGQEEQITPPSSPAPFHDWDDWSPVQYFPDYDNDSGTIYRSDKATLGHDLEEQILGVITESQVPHDLFTEYSVKELGLISVIPEVRRWYWLVLLFLF
ncbi:hypothetical protein OWV82_020313 [Melia azedarach]|uniref:Uncharacterized protein n=1 Tax=Melia azedarach TaxID=155640 RepID=A0ACC1X7Q4_MELAZ|nr:hypothetical protein OWV82_020313 [Melia azedarach]